MKSKFKFLLKDSIKKKLDTKAFKLINLVLLIVIVCLINLDSLVKLFGGDFNDEVTIHVVDEVGVYDEFKEVMDKSYLDVLENYNSKVVKADKSLDEIKKQIIEDESDDIIINITPVENPTYENVFNVEFMSYEYVDSILYTNIVNAINTTKTARAMQMANIDSSVLDSIYKNVEIKRVLLNEDMNEDEEFMELIGSVITIVFIVPFFLLITMIVQMIGAEINEEKSSRSMEIIISSVSPETHFMSKLLSANVFAITQGALLILYTIIGGVVRMFTSSDLSTTANVVGMQSADGATKITGVINTFIHSEAASRLLSGIPLFIIIILLSFFAYSLFTGILASITTNMEDFNQIQTPVMVFLMLGYFLAIYASIFKGSVFIKIMSFVPFISGILAPVMYTLGQITIWGLIISIVLLILTCYLLYKYGLKVYKVGILNYSSSNLWKKIFKALKS